MNQRTKQDTVHLRTTEDLNINGLDVTVISPFQKGQQTDSFNKDAKTDRTQPILQHRKLLNSAERTLVKNIAESFMTEKTNKSTKILVHIYESPSEQPLGD